MKKKLATLLLTSSLLASTMIAPIAASADELQNKIEQQESKLEAIQSEVLSAQQTLTAVQAEISAAESRSNELLESRITTQDEVTTLAEEIEKLEIIIEKREEQLQEQARSVQVNGSNTNYINFVFASESLTDLVARVEVVTTMVSANKSLVEQQISDKEAVTDKKVASEEKLEEIIGMSTELEQLKADLHIKKIEEESAIAALNAEQSTVQADRDKFIAQKEEADRRAAEEAAAIAAAEAAAIAAAEEAARVAAIAVEEVAEVETVATTSRNVAAPAVTAPQQSAPTETVAQAPATTPESTPAPTPAPAPAPAPSHSGDLIGEAYKYLGVPYVWGGKTPAGFDCSGFTSYVFRQAYGMEIGSWTGAQENLGTKISVSQAQPGDLLFWGSAGSTYHVAIYLGGGSYIHAPYEGRTVEVNTISNFTPQFAVRVN
ncbi:NlpC/P60 family protein [Jeotgalibaca porci]|uniref:C40 family peptidase n=1 Tax=Jeotgalibaca porci TaxID=1868793 RepID=UPI00359F8E20